MADNESGLSGWALILGASSGFGAATARELSKHGMNICGVHLDRRATMPLVQSVIDDIEATGQKALFFNVNAADPEKRQEILSALSKQSAKVRVLMHSLAFGTLRQFFDEEPSHALTQKQMDMTFDVMANSLVYWTQDIQSSRMFDDDARIFAMTSEGSTRIWPSYGAVSAAKAALESHIRQIAVELGHAGIAANAIQAGVTDTPAQNKIPGAQEMLDGALRRNPRGRLTAPEDVARTIRVLSMPGIGWLTGNVIRVDGGESLGA